MRNISIKKTADFPNAKFLVQVTNSNKTRHKVTLPKDYYQKLTRDKITPLKLIERSFKFLLQRESNISILSVFSLDQIQDFFPEYEVTIQKEIGV